ncbi:5-(carboxyamino)imidazole ribonucleotide synthase [Alkalicoccus halolimnae]|uniref:N5-carboxyaminoimidazole ribonucleotide synthase n=1 Tax=Alkalicoccus halolimnae TaxID=1667239 RepID=A0A5C7FMR4_9BACI|nr:5-(carboxyamino)imidazole ribonucleotide synthase [Alkalicoccus halolimnae]TXF86055.1 5-(carboxyamino)imidazole ribonucleotide synthase [Alkalicoccus halolimnae]
MEQTWIAPGSTIGILGGGQLGRMMALSAREMGYRIAVMEPKKDSPCGMTADHEVVAGYEDQDGAEELASMCDVLTYEFENITAETAVFLEEKIYFPQGSRLLQISQDRLKEKETIQSFDIPVAPYRAVYTYTELKEAAEAIGLPAVLKTTRGGYDGKGQFILEEKADIDKGWEALKGGGPFVLEEKIPFDTEVSIVLTRSVLGEMSVFPAAENIHRDGVLHQTIVPARISAKAAERAEMLARQFAESIELIGTLAVEMFVTGDTISVNEIAPRPHNSGHFTINACETSQFEQHIRALCGWPLGSTALLKPAVMVNLLGQHVEPYLQNHTSLPPAHVHLYGKDEAKSGRKMGHVTYLTENVESLLAEINASSIWKQTQLTGGQS